MTNANTKIIIGIIAIITLVTACSPSDQPTTSSNVETTASEWIQNTPTYAFDGSDLSLEQHVVQETNPPKHVLTYNFTSSHGGYGNRTGKMVTQVITPHTITVTLVNNNVTKAVIDDYWNVLEQRPVEKKVTLAYRPEQCKKTPWEKTYQAGNITFSTKPTDIELITAYYSTRNVSLTSVSKQSTGRAVCQACGCPHSYFYVATTTTASADTLKDDGWGEIQQGTPKPVRSN